MKYVSFIRNDLHSIGIWHNGRIFDIPAAARAFGNTTMPNTMLALLDDFEYYHRQVRDMFSQSDPGRRPELFFPDGQASLLPPLPDPRSVRMFYSFPEHCQATAEYFDMPDLENRSDSPRFVRINHLALYGPGSEVPYPQETSHLDYEMQIGVVLGRQGRNIPVSTADDYIAGYVIINSWTARDIEREELQTGLGPGQSRDFALSLGPYLVTGDEVGEDTTETSMSLRMSASINGAQYSADNTADMAYSFQEMIHSVSKNSTVHPGEVLCSGASGTGSILSMGPDSYPWLEPADTIQLEIEKIGTLHNTIGASEPN